jgi:GNAT superfamily N-acetyltransferase
MGAVFAIRSCRLNDFGRLKSIEIDAFATLEAAGAVKGAASSSSDEELSRYVDAGFLLVAADIDDRAIGYVGALFEGECLHVQEIDVAPDWQRRGIGRALMQAVLGEGRARGLRAATLTTDRLAPFNAPFYASLGFLLLDEADLSDRLRTILASEHAAGFDPARRVAMIRCLQQ